MDHEGRVSAFCSQPVEDLGVAALDGNGRAALTTTGFVAGAGPHAVVACYCGDAVLAPSSAAATFPVERAATTIGITTLAQPGDRAGGG